MAARILIASALLLLLALCCGSGAYLSLVSRRSSLQLAELEQRLSESKLAARQAEETAADIRFRLVKAERRASAAEALASGCNCSLAGGLAAAAGGPAAAQRSAEGGGIGGRQWERSESNVRMHAMLERLANPKREIMLALANDVMMCTNRKTCWWNGGNILRDFLRNLQRLEVRNYVVVTLDNATEDFCQDFGGVNSLRLELPVPTAQQGSRGANMISTLKYGLLSSLLLMKASVLVVDLDLVFLKDPFAHLYRDADLEASTDGFSAQWAKGHFQSIHDPKMGWGAGGLYNQHFTLNVGCAFFRPTASALNLVDRVAERLSRAAAWDQQVFNEEVFMLSHGSYNGSKVGVRVMTFDQWVNSKVFFYSSRRAFFPGKPTKLEDQPVMVHMNYHPDKHKRMLCVQERYIAQNWSACDGFPPGGV